MFLILGSQEHSAALALVSTRSSSTTNQNTATVVAQSNSSLGPLSTIPIQPEEGRKIIDQDLDMQRATDLVELHYGFKMKHSQGVDQDLLQAKKDVENIMGNLRKQGLVDAN